MNRQQASIRQLALINHSNHCYFNATLYAILWVNASVPSGQCFLGPPLQRLAAWLTRKPQSVELWGVTAWRQMLQGWQLPHQQHDTAELLTFLEHVLHPAFAHGHWQTRNPCPGNSFQVTDHGNMWPMLLPASLHPGTSTEGSVTSVQSLLIDWRNHQAQRQAAVTLPPVLPLQIGRFDNRGSKIAGDIVLTPTIHVPLFADDSIRTVSRQYQLCAAVYHIGDTIASGHYRTVLYVAGRPTAITEDNQTPVSWTQSDLHTVQRNAYLLLYIGIGHDR